MRPQLIPLAFNPSPLQVLLGPVPVLDVPLGLLAELFKLRLELPLLAPHLCLQLDQLRVKLLLYLIYHGPAYQPRSLLSGEALVEVHLHVGRVNVQVAAGLKMEAV